MTTLTSQIDAFVASQNAHRGQPGEEVALDYDALTGTVPAGGNAVYGISTIAVGAQPVSLGVGANTVILQGVHSTTVAANGQPDSFAISTDAAGVVTLLDEDAQQTQTITGTSYLVFNGGATNADGSYQSIVMIERGASAQVAALYNAALGRLPDLPGVEYYAARLADGEQTIQQQAANFIASPEFQSRFPAASLPADNGGADDAAYVTALYQNVLGRTPSATELTYYVAGLHNGEAGSIVDPTNPVQWSRAQELVNFAVSNENQADISGWLINTGNGAYKDQGFLLPGSQNVGTVLSAPAGGTIDTGAIDLSTITGGSASANGGWSPTGAGGVLLVTTFANPVGAQGGGVYIGEDNRTVELSANFPNAQFYTATNTTIYGSSSGHGAFIYQNDTQIAGTPPTEILMEGAGNAVYLSGTANQLVALNDSFGGNGTGLTHAAPNVLLIYGADTSDLIEFANHHGSAPGATGPQVDIIQTPAAGTKIQGSTFISPTVGTNASTPAGNWFVDTTIAINVGTVNGNSAAAMAAAANLVYQPTSNETGSAHFGQEEIVFYGKGTNNDTVVYKWFADDTHQITATTMIAGLDLIGVNTTQFEAMLKF